VSVSVDGTGKETVLANVIEVKPINVLNELEVIPTPISLTFIDEKIMLLRDKAELVTDNNNKRELSALIERLENRKNYHLHQEFFERFQNTTDEAIAKLLKNYNLMLGKAENFIPDFPESAISIMKEYKKKCIKVCQQYPVFYVIAPEKMFKKVNEKRDPILLVQSPFGFYWQILGAWDDEMVLLWKL
jgi:hypothetical protein